MNNTSPSINKVGEIRSQTAARSVVVNDVSLDDINLYASAEDSLSTGDKFHSANSSRPGSPDDPRDLEAQ